MILPREKVKEVISKYRSRELDRQQLAKHFKLDIDYVESLLSYHKVKRWDLKRRNIPEDVLEVIIKKYQEKKITRRKISDKYGINYSSLDTMFRRRGVLIWDLKMEEGKDNNIDEYYSFKRDKRPYARLFYEYNKY